jgi:hypothetical protein
VPKSIRMTLPTALILGAIASGARYGFDIMDQTGLPSGTVCSPPDGNRPRMPRPPADPGGDCTS